MSPLPERRKTPEELAELRKSLGIDGERPPADAPGMAGAAPEEPDAPGEEPSDLESAVYEPEARSDLGEETAEREAPRAKWSLRKSEQKPRAVPKTEELLEESGKIPVRRHNEGELQKLRRMQSTPPAANQPAQQLAQMRVSTPVLILIYGVAAVAWIVATVFGVMKRSMYDPPQLWLGRIFAREDVLTIFFSILAGGALVLLLAAGWIQWRKPRSQHHAALMLILVVLVLTFGILYFFPNLYGA